MDGVIPSRRAFSTEADAERAGMWVRGALLGQPDAAKWCRQNGVTITRVAGEGSNPSGGYVVPSLVASKIIALRETYGALRSSADVVPMGSDVVTWPRRTSGVSAYFVGENAQITESQFALDGVSLSAKKIGALIRTSSELEEDSAADLGNFVAAEMAYSFAVKEDLTGFLGDGTSTYGGISGICPMLLDGNHGAGRVAAAAGHDTYAELDIVDLGALIAAAPAVALPGARWFISQFGYATVFCRLAASAGGIVVMPDADGRLRPHFLGFPVVLTQALPQVGTTLAGSVMLLFGDLRLAAMLGDRRTMAMVRSEDRYFDADQIAFKGLERIDVVCHSLGDNTTAGAMVGLVGTA